MFFALDALRITDVYIHEYIFLLYGLGVIIISYAIVLWCMQKRGHTYQDLPWTDYIFLQCILKACVVIWGLWFFLTFAHKKVHECEFIIFNIMYFLSKSVQTNPCNTVSKKKKLRVVSKLMTWMMVAKSSVRSCQVINKTQDVVLYACVVFTRFHTIFCVWFFNASNHHRVLLFLH